MAATTNLRKSSSRNLPFLLIENKFWKTTCHKTNLVRSRQNPCFKFSRFSFICPKRQMQNCHFLFQQIYELKYLIVSWRSNLESGKGLGG